jgi:hypothetical protein
MEIRYLLDKLKLLESEQLLAPNGKPSNLNPVQYQQVRTPEFKSWFGDWETGKSSSRVLDENGEPQVMYHGSKSDFAEFSHQFVGSGLDQYGSGFYFTSAQHTASGYADSTGAVYSTFLNVRKPLLTTKTGRLSAMQIQSIIMLSPELDDALSNFGDVEYEGKNKVIREAVLTFFEHQSDTILKTLHLLSNDFYRNNAGAFLQAVKKVLKYDGVIVKFDAEFFVIAFEPNQVKSAIGNTGSFSKKSNKMHEEL